MSAEPFAPRKPLPRPLTHWRHAGNRLSGAAGGSGLSPRAALVLGGLLLCFGGLLFLAASGWMHFDATRLRAPREILMCAALVFGLPGLSMLLGERAPGWFAGLTGALLWTAFALIPLWIAFGSGPRVFGGNLAAWLALFRVDSLGARLGQVVFGGVGLLLALLAGAAWLSWLAALPRWAKPLGLVALAAAPGWLAWGRYLEPTAAAGTSSQQQLARHIAALQADPDFKVAKIGGGANPYLHPVQEHWVKSARNRLTASRVAPIGQTVALIPTAARAPAIDGVITAQEWRAALKIPLQPPENLVVAYFLRHGERLYMAAEVPSDRTDKGYDQFRVILHQQLTPELAFERIHIGRHRDATALRSVTTGANQQHQTHWDIYQSLVGASSVQGYRQFEASVDLTEAGLSSGAPFPVDLEVEGDPLLNEQGKFKARRFEGRAGDRASPLWLRIGP